jgi:hypothetical protein
MHTLWVIVRDFYNRFERPISSLSLVGGFVFDALTLQRIDETWENIWIVGHLIIVAVFIILVNSHRHSEGDEHDPSKPNFWYVNILQFFFGGILGTYLIFYFRSADLGTSWLFLLFLGIIFWANESLKRHYVRLYFQISLFFLSLFLFFIFYIPVLMHRIGADVFVYAGLVSVFLTLLFIYSIKLWNKNKFVENRKVIYLTILILFASMNILYFARIIPPIPLSLKNDGVGHFIERTSGGNYRAYVEDYGFLRHLIVYDNVYVSVDDPVYVYSTIFSPTDLNTSVYHRWQMYSMEDNRWIDMGKVKLSLIGGRTLGYRTYSVKTGLSEGRWRVIVETGSGHRLGVTRFTILHGKSPAPYIYKSF